VYVPEWPFSFAQLVERGVVQVFESLHGAFAQSFREPCVVFADHPSLRLGSVVPLIDLWGSSAANRVIVTDPDFTLSEVSPSFIQKNC
jgi:integrator complex subunit 9